MSPLRPNLEDAARQHGPARTSSCQEQARSPHAATRTATRPDCNPACTATVHAGPRGERVRGRTRHSGGSERAVRRRAHSFAQRRCCEHCTLCARTSPSACGRSTAGRTHSRGPLCGPTLSCPRLLYSRFESLRSRWMIQLSCMYLSRVPARCGALRGYLQRVPARCG